MSKLMLIEAASLVNCEPKIVWDHKLEYIPIGTIRTDHPERIDIDAFRLIEGNLYNQKGMLKAKRNGRYQSNSKLQSSIGITHIQIVRAREVDESYLEGKEPTIDKTVDYKEIAKRYDKIDEAYHENMKRFKYMQEERDRIKRNS